MKLFRPIALCLFMIAPAASAQDSVDQDAARAQSDAALKAKIHAALKARADALARFQANQATRAAALSGSKVNVTILAGPTCATWDASRKTEGSESLEGFVTGLIDGLSLGSGTEFWAASTPPLEQEQVMFWMDRYCDANPLKDVTDGSVTLMNERTNGTYSKRVSSQPE